MTIIREIDGKKYTFLLTARERITAYYEQQAAFDREDMETVINELDSDDLDDLGTSRAEALCRLDALAEKFREEMDRQYSVNISYTDIALNVLEDYFLPGKQTLSPGYISPLWET